LGKINELKKLNFWTQWKSYFKDVLIESSSTEQNPVLELYLSKGEYKLCADKAIYSFGMRYHNFVETFEQLNIAKFAPKNVLILGLGTGSILQLLEQKYFIKSHYTCIENDATIIQWYRKYIAPTITSQVIILNDDAYEYISQCNNLFDLICMDIFVDDSIPGKFESFQFSEQLYKLLSNRGILIYNRLAEKETDNKKNNQYIDSIFTKVFQNHQILKLATNWMLIGKK
jgi:spermidine synthase